MAHKVQLDQIFLKRESAVNSSPLIHQILGLIAVRENTTISDIIDSVSQKKHEDVELSRALTIFIMAYLKFDASLK
jgi:predicted DNA-binding ribbon-helix-helix protein